MNQKAEQPQRTPEEEDEYWELFRNMNRTYWLFEKHGLDCFNEDGTITELDGPGIYDTIAVDVFLGDMIDYYEKKEWYNKCAFLHNLQIELLERTRLYNEKQNQLTG